MNWPPTTARRRMALGVGLCVLAVLLLGAAVWQHTGALGSEKHLTSWLEGQGINSKPDSLWHLDHAPLIVLVLPGEPGFFVFAMLLMAYLAMGRGDRQMAILAVVGPTLSIAITDWAAKPLVNRSGVHGTGLEFPSGHATAAAALALTLYMLLRRSYGEVVARRSIPLLGAVPLLTGFGVLSLHWHFLLDVPGGWAVGLGTVWACAYFLLARRPVAVGSSETASTQGIMRSQV